MSHYQDVYDPIDEDRVEHTWECDFAGCTASIEKTGTYGEAWLAAKRDGWRCRTDGSGNWSHFCPEHR